MSEPRWDDERLHDAFADAYGRPAPEELVASTVAEVRRHRARPVGRLDSTAWLGGAVAAAVVLALALGSVVRPSQPDALSGSPPGATIAPTAASSPQGTRSARWRHVVDLGDGAEVVVSDPTGVVIGARPPWLAGSAVAGHEVLIEWNGSRCDETWTVTVHDRTPTIEFEHPAVMCAAVPVRRQLVLAFAMPVAPTDVRLRGRAGLLRASEAPVEVAFPPAVLGLPVISVSEAIAHRDAGPDGTEIAVRGWEHYRGTSIPLCVEPPHDISPVQWRCPDRGWLTEEPEDLIGADRGGPLEAPTGPAIQPLYRIEVPREPDDQPEHLEFWIDPPDPMPVVLVGHFDDHRSLLCDDVDACRRQFVVDARVWASGQVTGGEMVHASNGPAPGLTRDEAVAIASGRHGAPLAPAWVALVDAENIWHVDPRLADPPALVWVVRELVNEDGRPVARTFFVDDATGDLYQSTADGIETITE